MNTKYEGSISRDLEVMNIFRNLNAKCDGKTDRGTDRQTDGRTLLSRAILKQRYINEHRLVTTIRAKRDYRDFARRKRDLYHLTSIGQPLITLCYLASSCATAACQPT
ncbi:hypothetical protein DPMN_044239 [Dreissena polymorpha]|uniref:Uncharacterized protein n=1 Tax=Dreissena polymorpha TaxID=45954 RepID=A0A9D4D487_DREPO|nr:hypothetical protein DPMN_044239 [Dreissena polymorpha]